MKKYFFMIFILFSIPFIISLEQSDYDFDYPGLNIYSGGNYTINTNNSIYWDGHAFVSGAVSTIETDPVCTANLTNYWRVNDGGETRNFNTTGNVTANAFIFDAQQDYKFFIYNASTNQLPTLQNQNSGKGSFFQLFSKDMDGTDSVVFRIIGNGTPDVNDTRLVIRFTNTGTNDIFSGRSGSGSLIPLKIYTATDTNQIYLDTDGQVGIGKIPNYDLDVNGTIAGNDVAALTGVTAGSYFYTPGYITSIGNIYNYGNIYTTNGYVYGNEYVSSLGNVYSTAGDIYTVNVGGDLWLGTATQSSANFQAYATGEVRTDADNIYYKWGEGQQSGIMYNGSDMFINPKLVGTGKGYFFGDYIINETLKVLGNTTLRKTDVVGNLNQTSGNFTGNNIYGGMYYHNHTGTLLNFASAGVYYQLFFTNFTHYNGVGSEGISFGGNSNLTIQSSGVYMVNYMAIGDGQNNHIYRTSVFVNETNKDNCESHHKMSAGGDVITQTGTCILRLNQGEKISVRTSDEGSTGTGNYYGGNIDLVRIGN